MSLGMMTKPSTSGEVLDRTTFCLSFRAFNNKPYIDYQLSIFRFGPCRMCPTYDRFNNKRISKPMRSRRRSNINTSIVDSEQRTDVNSN